MIKETRGGREESDKGKIYTKEKKKRKRRD